MKTELAPEIYLERYKMCLAEVGLPEPEAFWNANTGRISAGYCNWSIKVSHLRMRYRALKLAKGDFWVPGSAGDVKLGDGFDAWLVAYRKLNPLSRIVDDETVSMAS